MNDQKIEHPINRTGLMGSLVLGTGLVFASLILIPALAAKFGFGPSLTGALRIALMKASYKTIGRDSGEAEITSTFFNCH